MTENVMHICGCSIEMELAEELGLIGKCQGCRYLDWNPNGDYCSKKNELLPELKEDCKDWAVDIR